MKKEKLSTIPKNYVMSNKVSMLLKIEELPAFMQLYKEGAVQQAQEGILDKMTEALAEGDKDSLDLCESSLEMIDAMSAVNKDTAPLVYN